MNMKITLWAFGLLALCLIWGAVMDTTIWGPVNLANRLGAAIGMGAPLYLGSGVLGLIAYAVKRNSTSAMWVWTIALGVALLLFSIGATQVPEPPKIG